MAAVYQRAAIDGLDILLATSAWICYLRPRGWDDLKIAVQHVLTAEQV